MYIDKLFELLIQITIINIIAVFIYIFLILNPMKTYLDYLAQDNCINLGQLCVYNDYLEQNNKRDSLKKFGGNIFLRFN